MMFPIQREYDDCGKLIFHPECFDASCNTFDQDVGLGPGAKRVIEIAAYPDGEALDTPELWIFVHGFEPYRLGVIPTNGDKVTYTINWEFRRSLEAGSVFFGLWFPLLKKWKFSRIGDSGYVEKDTHVEITINEPAPVGFIVPPEVAAITNEIDCGDVGARFAILVYDCTCDDCTKPYDNTVFCLDCYDETPFSVQHLNRPGLDKQVFTMENEVVKPLRAVSLTRSADAFNENLQLLYQSQKWVMVWDLEKRRLMDFFPQEWLRYGASAYFQNQTFRKEVGPCSSRVPYYVEVVDLGLVNSPQGSFDMDKDVWGQRTTNWDVPSRLMALTYSKQQTPAYGHGLPNGGVNDQALNAEFNQMSIGQFKRTAQNAIEAQRERFFRDRDMFLDHTARQRYHDDIKFLMVEVAERTLRLMRDGVENLKLIVDTFNPDADGSFGYFLVVLINSISNKIARSQNDFTAGIFEDTTLGQDEETASDWARYIYGELRRMVEIAKVEKKDIQTGLLKALSAEDFATNPQAALDAFKSLNFDSIEEQFELAANSKIPAGAGLVDPDTQEENRDRGLN